MELRLESTVPYYEFTKIGTRPRYRPLQISLGEKTGGQLEILHTQRFDRTFEQAQVAYIQVLAGGQYIAVEPAPVGHSGEGLKRERG